MKKYFQTTKIAIAFNQVHQHRLLLTYFGKEWYCAKESGIVSFFIEQKEIPNGLILNSYQYGELSDFTVMPEYPVISFNEFLFLTNPAAFWPASQLLPTQKNK